MKSRSTLALTAVALGIVAAVTRCAESTTEPTDAAPTPSCEDAGGRPGTGCSCDPAKYKPTVCYDGPFGTSTVGVCKTGMRTCDPTSHTLSPCVGEVLPKPEICNLVDDDCNGIVDDAPGVTNASPIGWCTSPACDPDHGDAAITCFAPTKQGLCGAGAVVCGPGGTLRCSAFGITPTDETCNGLDDDCDGTVDNLSMDLGPCDADGGIGECAHSTVQCVSGAELCPPSKPGQETCDGKDNDCNGKVDDKSCTQGMNIYCCQNLSNAWGCTSTPNDGQHKSCSVGL